MMTYAWTLNHMLSKELKPINPNQETLTYVVQLVIQLTVKRALYAEMRWRDPLDECLPENVHNVNKRRE
jgi:hypothetical protein